VRKILLSDIMSSKGIYENKYTDAFNSIKAVIELEKKEKKSDMLPDSYFTRFIAIEKNSDKLDDQLQEVPLCVVEQFFMRNSRDLGRYLYMSYGKVEVHNMQVINLYDILERFFMKIYILAVEIADHYSLEIKLKKDNKNKEAIL